MNLAKKFIKDSSMYDININRALKSIQSNMIANFIQAKDKEIVITTNNVSSNADLQKIEKYIKNSHSSDAEQISFPRLSQSKSYFKIVGIPYNNESSNTHIFLDNIKCILKSNYIFNDIVLVSKPYIIKVSPKFDMAII